MNPLDDVLVVGLEQAVAAPFATRQLAHLGAGVIKIERPDGGDFARGYDTAVRGMSSQFVWLNQSKQSLTLDLKHAQAQPVLHRLLEKADVFVQNLGPGAAERLGLAADVLRERYPRLVICTISGYGSAGPYAGDKAYDLLVQGETGLVSISGSPAAPARAGISIADIAAGMHAVVGIMTALYRRERTGSGCALEVSLFDALSEWMSYPAYFARYGGHSLPRTGVHHASIAPYGPVSLSDGEIVIAMQNEREWQRFCDIVLQEPLLANDARFASNPQRVTHRYALEAGIRETGSADRTGGCAATRAGGNNAWPPEISRELSLPSTADRAQPLAGCRLAGWHSAAA